MFVCLALQKKPRGVLWPAGSSDFIGLLGIGVAALPGLLPGLFIGALVVEHRKKKSLGLSVWAGVGSLFGWAMGVGVKILVAIAILVLTLRYVPFKF